MWIPFQHCWTWLNSSTPRERRIYSSLQQTTFENISIVAKGNAAQFMPSSLYSMQIPHFWKPMSIILILISKKSSAVQNDCGVEELTMFNTSTSAAFCNSRLFFSKLKFSKIVFKNEVFYYLKLKTLFANGNIAQIEQYFLRQQCFQMSPVATTNESVSGSWKSFGTIEYPEFLLITRAYKRKDYKHV